MTESRKAQEDLIKAEKDLVEVTKVNMIFLQSIEESQKSLEDIKTKLQEVETLEEALKDDLKKVIDLAQTL